MKPLTFAALILITGIQLFAQDESLPRIKAGDILIQTGFSTYSYPNFTLSDFKTLAPGSDLLNNDLSQYSLGSYNWNGCSTFAASIGLRFLDKEGKNYKLNPVVRIGIIYNGFCNSNLYYSKEDAFPYDTLTSSATGDIYLIDSVFNSSYSMNYNSSDLGLSFSADFSTNNENRVTLFAGVGISASLSTLTETTVNRYEYSTMSYDETPEYWISSGFDDSSEEFESFSNKTFAHFSAGIPLGIDFRLGKDNEFWRQLHFVYEIRPVLNIVSIPELKTYTGTGVSNMFGLKVVW